MSQDIYQMSQNIYQMSQDIYQMSLINLSNFQIFFCSILYILYIAACSKVDNLNAFKYFVLYRQKYFLIGTHYELDKLMELDESAAVHIHLNNQVRPCLYFSP